MYVNEYIPFLEKSPVIERRKGKVKTGQLFFPFRFVFNNKTEDVLNLDSGELKNLMLSKRPNVYKVDPLDLYILDEPIFFVRWYKNNVDEMDCFIQEVDYSKIAKDIEIEEMEHPDDPEMTQKIAFYFESNGSLEQEIFTSKFIASASNGVTPESIDVEETEIDMDSFSRSFEGYSSKISPVLELTEDVSTDTLSRFSNLGDAGVVDKEAQTPMEISLEAYLLGDYVTERIPVLLGPTAVLKSATVKALAEKHNMRVVDLRVSFMDRLDFEGLTEKVDTGEGDVVSYNAPMLPIIECTDAFIDFCRKAIPKVESKLEEEKEKDFPDQTLIEELESLLKHYREKAKIPVLLFDEVTRSEKSVRNAMTKMLNQKEFMGYKMTKARILSATNYPVGIIEQIEDERTRAVLRDMYLTADITDVASLDRFEPLQVAPADVEDTWINWAEKHNQSKDRQNIHPFVLEFLENNSQFYYFYDDVIDTFEDENDFHALSTTPFPNYRTWEMVSDYLYKVDESEDKRIMTHTIEGLIGFRAGERFHNFCREKNYEIYTPEEKDEMDEIVSDGMQKNLPTMMIGPSSIGKTSRIKNMAKESGIEDSNFIEINLALQDRVDIMGPPVKVDLASYVGGLGSGIEDNVFGEVTDLGRELQDIIKEVELPQKVTIKAPKSDIKNKLETAMREGEPVVLFFDELNRVTNPAIMTAVFEAISDNRIFGVEFDPDLVRIFSAVNLGPETDDAEDIDPAFLARFNLYRRQEYKEADVDAMIEYWKENDFNEYLISYVENMERDEVLNIISSIEERELSKAVPSMRAFSDLDKLLKDENVKILNGTMLFADKKIQSNYTDLVVSGDSDDIYRKAKEVAETAKLKLDNWSGLATDMHIEDSEGNIININDLADAFEEFYDSLYLDSSIEDYNEQEVLVFKDVIANMYYIEDEISKKRKKLLSYRIGDQADMFCDYYNTVSGTDSVTVEISDLKDVNLIPKYFEIHMAGITSPSDIIDALVGHYEKFYQEFRDTLSVDHYRSWIRESMYAVPTADGRYILLRKLVADDNTDLIFELAEQGDTGFTQEVLKQAGRDVDEEEFEVEDDEEGIL